MKTKHRSRWILVAVAALVGSAFELQILSGDAHAIIGRPLTPFSYAGVARRTTRRAVMFGGAARYAAPAPYAYPAPAPYPYYW